MNDYMIDLETLGTRPGSVILSIGIAQFGPSGLGDVFYETVNLKNSMSRGLTIDASTLGWWNQQSEAARRVLDHVTRDTALNLVTALEKVSLFIPPDAKVWGNGASFDNALLAAAYAQVGEPTPWKFYNDRCFRTLKNLVSTPAPERKGTHHNALDDAVHQAEHARAIFKAIGVWA